MAIWQDLVSDHGFPHGYQTVKRFVRKLRGSESPQAVGIILTAAGEEAQVDYGSGPMARDAQSGKCRRTRLFVLTLGYSRKSVRLLAWRSSARVWAELYERDALREPRGSADVFGSLGTTLGRHAHPWHDQTPGRRHVRRRKAALAPSAAGTLPLLPLLGTVVHLDGCVEVEAAYYGLPPGWIGRVRGVRDCANLRRPESGSRSSAN
jgi:hypothetical protein